MKRKPNYLKHILQWGVLAAIAGTVLWANFSEKPVDVEAYCPFGGLQAFGTYLVNNSLACSMSMLQIMMGLVLAVGVILFSKLFCGYLCPLGTVGEWMGRAGKKLHLQVEVPSGSIVDKLLRVVKYVLLFTILYFTLSSSELFCKKLDPFYAVATGFKGEIVLWMSLTSLTLLLLGGFVGESSCWLRGEDVLVQVYLSAGGGQQHFQIYAAVRHRGSRRLDSRHAGRCERMGLDHRRRMSGRICRRDRQDAQLRLPADVHRA